MNIFVVDLNPVKAANQLCLKHVVNPLEQIGWEIEWPNIPWKYESEPRKKKWKLIADAIAKEAIARYIRNSTLTHKETMIKLTDPKTKATFHISINAITAITGGDATTNATGSNIYTGEGKVWATAESQEHIIENLLAILS